VASHGRGPYLSASLSANGSTNAGHVIECWSMIDRVAVILESQEPLNPADLAKALLPIGLPWAEITRACRRQRGILFRRLDQLIADSAVERLRSIGIPASAIPEPILPDFPRWISIASVLADDLGLRFPALEALGKQGFVPWEDLRLAHGCLCEGQTVSVLGDGADVIAKGGTDHEDHLQLGRDSFSEPPGTHFDWTSYLDTEPEDAVNTARLSRPKIQKPRRKLFAIAPRASAPAVKAVPRYAVGNPNLEARLLVWAGGSAMVMHGGVESDPTAVSLDGVRIAGHWLRGLQGLALLLCERATGALHTPSLLCMAERNSPAIAVVSDLAAFEDEARWWYGRMIGEESKQVAGYTQPDSGETR